MRKPTNMVHVAVALVGPALATGQELSASQSIVADDRVTFYQVPLMCPAARGLACGSRAKPVLLELERNAVVDEAWLDRTGETLAVVWREGSLAVERAAAINGATSAHEISIRELTQRARGEAERRFQSRVAWYRGSDVDRLSEEEAHVIAARLMRSLVAKAPTAAHKAESLKPVLAELIRAELVGSPSPSANLPDCCDTFRERMVTKARQHLSTTELNALLEVAELGFRPVGDEP